MKSILTESSDTVNLGYSAYRHTHTHTHTQFPLEFIISGVYKEKGETASASSALSFQFIVFHLFSPPPPFNSFTSMKRIARQGGDREK